MRSAEIRSDGEISYMNTPSRLHYGGYDDWYTNHWRVGCCIQDSNDGHRKSFTN